MEKRPWSKDELDSLMDDWGTVSMVTIGKNLGRTSSAVQQKASELGLGPFLESGEYITMNVLMHTMRGANGRTYTIKQWMDKGLPVKSKKVKNCNFKVVHLQDWWKWAKENSTLIDFSLLEPLMLGVEPEWLIHQRRADIEKRFFKKSPWTEAEDNQLKRMLNEYRYSYRELSLKLMRTEGALKRRMNDLNIKARPIKMSNHNPWTEKETKIIIELYNKGHSHNTMPNYIERSAQSCSGKIERLIKEGVISPRSEWRVSC